MNDITLNPPLFSLVNTFKEKINFVHKKRRGDTIGLVLLSVTDAIYSYEVLFDVYVVVKCLVLCSETEKGICGDRFVSIFFLTAEIF